VKYSAIAKCALAALAGFGRISYRLATCKMITMKAGRDNLNAESDRNRFPGAKLMIDGGAEFAVYPDGRKVATGRGKIYLRSSADARAFLLRALFDGVKSVGNESDEAKLKRIFDAEFKQAAIKAGFAKLESDGTQAPGDGTNGQPVSTGAPGTENELTPDRIYAILVGQGFDPATIEEIMRLIGADIGAGSNDGGGQPLGGASTPGATGQPISQAPQPMPGQYSEHIGLEKQAYKH